FDEDHGNDRYACRKRIDMEYAYRCRLTVLHTYIEIADVQAAHLILCYNLTLYIPYLKSRLPVVEGYIRSLSVMTGSQLCGGHHQQAADEITCQTAVYSFHRLAAISKRPGCYYAGCADIVCKIRIGGNLPCM